MQPRSSDIDACRATLKGGSRSFALASLLLPSDVRASAASLYAFCREADDAIDRDEGEVASLRARLDRVYAGREADEPVERALAACVERHAIPRALPEALLEGFAWDRAGRRYATLDALHDYAARVAGSVGAMMALVMGVRDRVALARACDLGIAMQLSNIARDVGEDARMGRCYLPLDWMAEAGIDVDRFVASPAFDARLGEVIARVLEAAERAYARARPGLAMLPRGCRPGIRAAASLYAEIGREVARRGFDSVSQRAVVGGWRKAAVVLASIATGARASVEEDVLPATRFLVDAVPHSGVTLAAGRIAWLVDLFSRLEAAERMGA